ncbi:hypothetical protein B0H11DRAFT_2087029 [Mycena galericulata]|nr:hypothetical protein B0H11DRAFT_2087029 [Mycena galericulata]
MTNSPAAQKQKRRREEKLLEGQRLRVEEGLARHVPVSTPVPHPSSMALVSEPIPRWRDFPRGHPAENWPLHLQAYLYDPTYPRDDDLPPQPIHVVHVANSISTRRDFSALRSTASAHPWRTIRRRNQRLLPESTARRPFPRSLPKRPVIHTIVDDPTPMPPPVVSVVTTPLPPVTIAPTLPADTAYGLVHTKLALACAREFPNSVLTLAEVFDITWGPQADNKHKGLMMELPADQLVFLAALAAIADAEPVFEGFLYPAIASFANGWVAHCRGDSFG